MAPASKTSQTTRRTAAKRGPRRADGARPATTGRRQLVVVALADFVVWAGGGAILPYLPVFLREQAHASLWWIGLIAASYFAGVFTVSPLAGRLSDRIGRKPLLVGGTLLYAAATLLFVSTTAPSLFIVFRFLEGISVALVVPAGQAFVAEITTDRNRSQAYGWLTTAQFGGLLVGPALAWALYELGGGRGPWAFYAIFIAGAALSVGAAVALAALIREPEHAARARRATAAPTGYRALLTPPVLAIIVVVASSEFAVGAWEVVWSIWLRSLGHSVAFVGLTWVAFSAPMLLSFAGGRLADRRSRLALMTAGFAGEAATWIAFSVSRDPAVYLAAAALGGLAFAFAFPAKQAMLVRVTPPRWLASVQGVEQTAIQAAAFAGTLVAPPLFSVLGGWIFAVCGLVALGGLAAALPTLRREWACLRRDGDARSCAHLASLARAAAERAGGGRGGEGAAAPAPGEAAA